MLKSLIKSEAKQLTSKNNTDLSVILPIVANTTGKLIDTFDRYSERETKLKLATTLTELEESKIENQHQKEMFKLKAKNDKEMKNMDMREDNFKNVFTEYTKKSDKEMQLKTKVINNILEAENGENNNAMMELLNYLSAESEKTDNFYIDLIKRSLNPDLNEI